MQRSLLRPDQFDSNGSYEFANLVIDGYSGGDLQDGYLTGLILESRADGGATTLELHADDGEINQVGTGQVTFAGNVDATNGVDVTGDNLTVALDAIVQGNGVIEGSLTVNGTTTTFDTQDLIVGDPITVLNASGSEVLSNWAGFSVRDTDGYNRIGWVFNDSQTGPDDGYWAISVAVESYSDTDPTRALAYLGAGDSYGDLSSTLAGDSGASKIGVEPAGGIVSTDVQAALEELQAEIDALSLGSLTLSGTTNLTFHVNSDATPAIDEDACLILAGGDGTALVEGYLCLITDSAANDRFQFTTYQDSVIQDTYIDINAAGVTDDIDAYLVFNAGDGGSSNTASLKLDGTADKLVYTATTHEFSGFISAQDDVGTQDRLDAYGNVRLGNSSADTLQVDATIISNLLPVDDTYYLGDTDNRWIDGYFSFFDPTYYTPVGDDNSLEGHLKGIDAALEDVTVDHPRAVYKITLAEALADELDTSRTPDQGDSIDISSLTDDAFRDDVKIFRNGQLLWNDGAPAASTGSLSNDVGRQTGSLADLLFSGNLRRGDVIQVFDFTGVSGSVPGWGNTLWGGAVW